MTERKNNGSRWGILVLLPVFLLYVNHSLVIYHTHILSNGVVITHAHSFNDCKKQFPAQKEHPAKKQVIVFQGLMLLLKDNPSPAIIIEDDSDFFVKISIPVIPLKNLSFIKNIQDRAPPFLST